MSARIYGWLVDFYPEDLRRDFGEEMVLVFEEELRDAGLAGAVRVWRRALVEFVRLALPNCVANPVLRVPAIMLAFCAFSMGTDLVLLYAKGARARFTFVALLPTLTSVIIPLAVMWACRSRPLTKLHLTDTER
jgi:hypothetical protein